MGKENVTLLIDVGNTSTKLLFKGLDDCKINLYIDDDYHSKLDRILSEINIVKVFISSVNSLARQKIVDYLSSKHLKSDSIYPLTLADKKEAAFRLGYQIPNLEALSDDLYFDILGQDFSSLLVDLGTAIKIMAVDEKGKFLGGIISPGLRLLNKSLGAGAEMLNEFNISIPQELISYETEPAINSSSTYGVGFMIEGYFKRLKDSIGTESKLIISGGDAYLMGKVLDKIGVSYCLKEEIVLAGMVKYLGILEKID